MHALKCHSVDSLWLPIANNILMISKNTAKLYGDALVYVWMNESNIICPKSYISHGWRFHALSWSDEISHGWKMYEIFDLSWSYMISHSLKFYEIFDLSWSGWISHGWKFYEILS